MIIKISWHPTVIIFFRFGSTEQTSTMTCHFFLNANSRVDYHHNHNVFTETKVCLRGSMSRNTAYHYVSCVHWLSSKRSVCVIFWKIFSGRFLDRNEKKGEKIWRSSADWNVFGSKNTATLFPVLTYWCNIITYGYENNTKLKNMFHERTRHLTRFMTVTLRWILC